MSVYSAGATLLFADNGFDDWNAGAAGLFKTMLLKTGFAQNQTHDFRGDVVADECDATNYSNTPRGGDMANRLLAHITPSPSDISRFDSDDVTFTALGGAVDNTLAGAIVYRDTAVDGTSALFCFSPFAPSVTTNGGDLTVEWAADGVTYLDATP